jgi:uncharacterized DUF497 family protein
MLPFRELVWDDWNEEHVARHNVTRREVEEVCFGRAFVVRMRRSRYRVVGQTEGGRYLTVILDSRQGREFYVVTARDAVEPERRRFRSWRGH